MTAPTPTEQATIERFETAAAADESLRERVARAIHQEQNRGAGWHLAAAYIRDEYRRLADAAIAVIPGQQ